MGRKRLNLDIPAGFFIGLFLVSFLIGIIIANRLWTAGVLEEMTSIYSIMGKYQIVEHPPRDYFLFLLKKKSVFMGSSLLAGIAGVGEIFALIAVIWLGFLAGGLAAMFLLQSGIRGLFFCALGILVQILLYIPAMVLFLLLVSGKSGYKQSGGRMHKKEIQRMLLICSLFVIGCLFGIFLETYVNPFLWLRSVI